MQNSKPFLSSGATNEASTTLQPQNRISGWLRTGFLVVLSIVLLSCLAAADANAQYTVTIDPAITNGSVTANDLNAAAAATITLSITPASGYELNVLTVTDDASNLVMKIDVPELTAQFAMPADNVTVTATFKKTNPQLEVEAVKSAIESITDLPSVPSTVNTPAEFQSWLADEINNNIIPDLTYTKDASDHDGVDGSFSFTVNMSIWGSSATASNSGTIIAKIYDSTVDDNAAISTAKSVIESVFQSNTNYNTITQAYVSTGEGSAIENAQLAIYNVIEWIRGMYTGGGGGTNPADVVTATIVYNVYTAAIAGDQSNPSGTNGKYTFTVQLNKGSGTQQETVELTMTITATTDNSTADDNAAISTSKSIIESRFQNNTQYNTITQEYVSIGGLDTDIENVQMAIYNAIRGIRDAYQGGGSSINPSNAVTATIVYKVYTAAIAGDSNNPSGTNGKYTFTVQLNKGSGTQQETVELTMTITATPYVAAQTYTVTTIVTEGEGTVSADPISAEAGANVMVRVTPADGYYSSAILTYKTGDPNTGVAASVLGHTGIFTMPAYGVTVEARFTKTEDQLVVEAAADAIAGMSNVTVGQETANTEAGVKTWLAGEINSLLTGMTISASNIKLSNFTAAVAGTGTASGVDGSFSFTVSLQKGSGTYGSAMIITARKNGTIKATVNVAPTYSITIPAMDNGTVTANVSSAKAGETVTLTITPAAGYELDAISTTPAVTLSGIGNNTRIFVMPAYDITVNAVFKKTQVQIDQDAVEDAIAAISGGTYRVAELTANDEASIKAWLVNTLNVLFGQSSGMQVKSTPEYTVGEVNVANFAPAYKGTEDNPNGTNGSYTYTVRLTRGTTTFTTAATKGVIVATPYAAIPLKRIELFSMSKLTARILNTGNTATGALTLALSGSNASDFNLPQATVSSLAAGGEADITLIPRAGLAKGTYRTTLTVNGEGIEAVSISVVYEVATSGNENFQASALKAYVQNGTLHVSGLTAGKTWSVYGISGALLYQGKASGGEAEVRLSARGVYIVTSDGQTVKVVY